MNSLCKFSTENARTPNMLFILFLIITSNFVQTCVVRSFNRTIVQVTNIEIMSYRVLVDRCIENTPEFENAATIDCVNECEVKSLRNGAVKNLAKLEHIKFVSSGISNIEIDAFIRLPKLLTIEILFNSVEFIASGTFKNLPLYTLKLDANQILRIQIAAFANLKNLEYFSVSWNQLTEWNPDWFENSPNLKTVFADNNYINVLGPSAFGNFPKLRYINLVNNHICKVDQTAFPNKKVMEKLFLQDNYIGHFHEETFVDVFNGSFLGILDISYNQLMYLKQETLDSFKPINEIALNFNPWSCACYKKITRWFSENKKKLAHGVEKPLCVVPLNGGDECKEEVDWESMDYFGKASNNKYCRDCCE